MDPDKKYTLALIEGQVHILSIEDRGKQLVQVACDYVEDGDLLYARDVLSRIEPSYFEDYLYQQAAGDKGLANSVAVLIDAFGVLFYLVSRPVGSA